MNTTLQPAPSQREQQRIQTRERIYQAAIVEFKEVGFENAQVDRIVEAAGVARGTFYFHFPKKEDVLLELQRRSSLAALARMSELRRPNSVKGLLYQLLDAIFATQEEIGHPGLFRDMLSMYIRGHVDIDVGTEPLISDLVQFFADAQKRGEVRSDIEPLDMMRLIGMNIFGLLILEPNERDLDDYRGLLKHTVDIFIRGISP